MNTEKKIIKRIKRGEAHVTVFKDGRVFSRGFSEVDRIKYHTDGLEYIAGLNIDDLLIVSARLKILVERLWAVKEAYVVSEADKIINGNYVPRSDVRSGGRGKL